MFVLYKTSFIKFYAILLYLSIWGSFVSGQVEPGKALAYRLEKDSTLPGKIRRAGQLRTTDPDSAMLLYRQVYTAAHHNRFLYGTHLVQVGISVLYIGKGDYVKSRILLEQVLHAPDYPEKKKLLVSLYINLAKLDILEGNFSRGYALLDTALRNQCLDSGSKAALFSNVGSVLRTVGEKDKSREYLMQAEQLAGYLKDTALLLAVYNSLVNCYKELGEKQKAILYNDKAVRLSMQYSDRSAQIYAWTARGTLHRTVKQNKEAFACFDSARAIASRNHIADYRLKTFLYLSLGELCVEQGDMERAVYYLSEGRSLALTRLDLAMQYKCLMAWAGYYRNNHNYPEAYRDLARAHELYDSILNKESHRNINELETRYRTAEKDRELALQSLQLSQKEQTIQRKNFWMAAVLLLVAFVTIVLFLVIRQKVKVRKITESNLEKDREIGIFKAMLEGEEKERSRIGKELHDGIISQLTAVRVRFSSFLVDNSVFNRSAFEQSYRYLDETMRDLRKTAHNLMPEAVAKGGLIGALSDFCSKMDNENATRIHFMTTGYSTLDKTLELSLYRIVQELVQNALKYAAAHTLLVQVNFFEQLIEITVEDDGNGFDTGGSTTGTGLRNIEDRIQAMSGHMELLSDLTRGTTVYIEIPLTSNFKDEHPYADKSGHNR